MTTDFLNRKEAVELFLSLLIAEAYDGTIEDVTSNLEKGPPGRKPREDLIILHQWFKNLDNESRKHVLAIIRQAIDTALFNCLVLLDGLGGYPVEGKISDFAAYLQTYENEDARKANSPQFSVRLNLAYTTEYLHDMFHWILEERSEREE
jgi:hypothetical protein